MGKLRHYRCLQFVDKYPPIPFFTEPLTLAFVYHFVGVARLRFLGFNAEKVAHHVETVGPGLGHRLRCVDSLGVAERNGRTPLYGVGGQPRGLGPGTGLECYRRPDLVLPDAGSVRAHPALFVRSQ